jgi:lipopolysaccharide/colanic/teichoic acid biosynthesis glycosyltransferase
MPEPDADVTSVVRQRKVARSAYGTYFIGTFTRSERRVYGRHVQCASGAVKEGADHGWSTVSGVVAIGYTDPQIGSLDVSDVALSGPFPPGDLAHVGGRGYLVTKRVLDVVLSGALLMLVSPVLLLVAVAIKLDDPGPAVFAQERVRGRRVRKDGASTWVLQPFTIYKFRTMRTDADPSVHRDYMKAYLAGDEERLSALRPGRREGDSYRPADDPRVTRVGAILRRLSLDELPQLWNVLRGDMSLVGPRPPLPYEVEMYQGHYLQRLASRPGITGWAQVRGRTTIGMEQTVRLDLEYIARQSIWLDLKILLLTIPVVLMQRGAD